MLGFAVLGAFTACGGDDTGQAEQEPDPAVTPEEDASPDAGAGALAWERVKLGFVSAYVLVRGQEAAIVDTGVPGSVDAIGTVLDDAGPGWAGVRHVVLTHKHPDHVGSIGEVLAQSPAATGYVGAGDLEDVDSPTPLEALSDGDEVFGLQMVGTPGHTAGHLAVFDDAAGVLVAGDALTNDGALSGSNPQFTEDEAAAEESIRALAALQPEVILVGHGEPLLQDAAGALDRLVTSLG